MTAVGTRPMEAGEATAYFAPGEAAEHQYGLIYQGEWETEWDGTAVAVRLHARALAATGLPVLLKSFSGLVTNAEGVPEPVVAVGVPEPVKAEIGGLPETSIGQVALSIRHLVVKDAGTLERYVMPRHVVHPDPTRLLALREAIYQSTVTYTVWERHRIAPAVAAILNRCAQAWVPCRQNAEALIGSGVRAERVHVVPHPYEPSDPICQLVRRKPVADRRFYAIGRWEPRKGFHELLGAFLAAFRPGDPVRLTIKSTPGEWRGYPTAEASLAHWLGVYDYWTPAQVAEQVHVDLRRYPRSRVLKLHFDHNIYVLPSHGEAWGLPAFEAKLAGNRLVHVPFGGSADYADLSDVTVPWTLGPVHPSYKWQRDGEWADYQVAALAEALHKTEAPAEYLRPAHYERVFGFSAVGRQMADLLLPHLDATQPEAAAWLRAQAGGAP